VSAQKLILLRGLFDQFGLDGYLVPKANKHQCEYLRPDEERLQWLTNFSGSAGSVIVLKNKAALFVDGRYILQAHHEVDKSLFDIIDTTYTSPLNWLMNHVSSGEKTGVDPWLITGHTFKAYQKLLKEKEASLLPVDQNLIDCLWQNKPTQPVHKAVIHPLEVSGLSHDEKIESLTERIKEKDADGTLITMVESVNWLFNIRGHDLDYMPVVFSFAFVHKDGRATLFMDLEKVTDEIRHHLGEKVTIQSYQAILSFLGGLGHHKPIILVNPVLSPLKLITILEETGSRVLCADDLTLLPKACKNPVEIRGMRETHLRDGAALTMFLHWVIKEAINQKVTEIEAVQKLYEFRARFPTFWGDSFPTISAVSAHGAIVHYRVTPSTDCLLEADGLYLVDSGAHYHDGSTDVTRTIVLGKPTPEQKDRFTRVLKGHIALAQLIFPQGTTGGQIDAFARSFLWQAGLDYAHGTGHGVGSVMNIHEGPQRISKSASTISLQPGMVVSNEPGYYKAEHYGIRLENLAVVVSVDIPGAEHPMLRFETLTLAPVDVRLIDHTLMTSSEIKWLNEYHQYVHDALAPLIEGVNAKKWFYDVTQPLCL
jgi:Xaa-Pro aminopeptidase